MEKPKPPGGKECAVCGEINMRGMQVFGETGRAKDLAGLVLKYGGITVSGVMCMKCVRRVIIIHKHAMRFYDLCHMKNGDKKEGLSRDSPLFGVNNPVKDGTSGLQTAMIYCLQSLPQSPVIHLPQSDIVMKPVALKKIDMPLSVLRPIAPKPHQSDTQAAGSGSLAGGTPTQSSTTVMNLGSSPNPHELQVNSSVPLQVYESVVTGLTSAEGVLDPRSGSPPPPKKPKIQPCPDDNWDSTPAGDHTYGKAMSAEEILKKHADEWLGFLTDDFFYPKSLEMISQDHQNILFIKAAEGQLSKIAEAVMRMPKLRARILACLMSDVSEALSYISNRKHGHLSCLKPNGLEDNMHFDWNSVIREMDMVSPELLKLCMAMLFKPDKSQLSSERMTKETVPKIGTVFAILVQGRIRELTKVQRIISLVLRRNGCKGKAVWQKINPLGLSLSYTSMIAVERGLSANKNLAISSEITDNEEDSAIIPAPENEKGTTPETEKSPTKTPEITDDETQEDSATIPALENKKGTTPETEKSPAMKPEITDNETQEDSATLPAPENKKGTTPETEKIPAMKPEITDNETQEDSATLPAPENKKRTKPETEKIPAMKPEITDDETQEDSATLPAPENKKRTTPETKKSPAKKPILKVIRRTVTSDQGGTTQTILDLSRGDFLKRELGAGAHEAVMEPTVALINTTAMDNAASQRNTLSLATQQKTLTTSFRLQPIETQVSDTPVDNLVNCDFIFQGNPV